MTPKCLVLLSNIVKSHILKSDLKRQNFNQLISLAEDKDVIDCIFYNIFLGVDFTGEVTFDDLFWSWYWALKCSCDIPSADLSFWGFYEAKLRAAVLVEVSFSIHEMIASWIKSKVSIKLCWPETEFTDWKFSVWPVHSPTPSEPDTDLLFSEVRRYYYSCVVHLICLRG